MTNGSMPAGATLDSDDTWRYGLDVDLTTGTGSMSIQYLGNDDGSLDPDESTELQPVPDLQDFDLGLSGAPAPSTWDGLGLRLNYGSADNIMIVPEPSVLLLLLGGLLAVAVRRVR